MNPMASPLAEPVAAGRVWSFGNCELDELRRELRVNGRRVELESKPLDILVQLLIHSGEVVTKEELLEAVWPSVMVVDGSLATAVSKLRKAVENEHSPIILTVPRVGYRMAVPVHCRALPPQPGPALGFEAGEMVPGREQWRLARLLDRSASSEVWVAENPKTRDRRVFKFAADGVRLASLKREVTVSRFLRESLGERPDFVKILEWNFSESPYFLESEYAGPNLKEWAEAQGGLSSVALGVRLQIVADVARAVADAHAIGLLHKDLKPANILIVLAPGAGVEVRIADFGSASLFDPSRLQALGITNLGFTQTQPGGANPPGGILTGTLMYIAPEVLAGNAPSASADVYALGVLLYQLVIGDFRRPLAPGWEAGVSDPVLRQDIADAACGDAEKRLGNAGELAERLTSLEARRVRQSELEAAQLRAEVAERKLAEARARTPWVVFAGVALAAGLAVSLTLYRGAARERDHASRQTAIASSINRFLADDLLGRSNPFASGKASESLTDAIKQASPAIDQQFKDEPLVAARLHQTIARALDNRTAYADARKEYEHAAALFRQTDGTLSQDAITTELQRATLEARSYEKDSLPLAKSIVAAQETLIGKVAHPRPEVPVWLASARGMIALIDNDAKTAAADFKTAVDTANVLPTFDESARLTFKQRLAFSYIRLGDGPKAEQLFRELIAEFSRITGPDSPNVLRVRLNLAQAFMIQNKHAEAIRETTEIYPRFIAELGPDHELTMQLLTTRAQSEGSLELWKDAIRDDMAIYDMALKKQGPLSFFAIATLADASLAMCRSGKLAEGVADSRKALSAATKAFGPQAALTEGVGSTLAGCLIGLGQLDEASSLLEGIDTAAVAQLAGDPDWGAGVKLLQAQIAFARGNLTLAQEYADEVTPIFTGPHAEAYQQKQLADLSAKLTADRRIAIAK